MRKQKKVMKQESKERDKQASKTWNTVKQYIKLLIDTWNSQHCREILIICQVKVMWLIRLNCQIWDIRF